MCVCIVCESVSRHRVGIDNILQHLPSAPPKLVPIHRRAHRRPLGVDQLRKEKESPRGGVWDDGRGGEEGVVRRDAFLVDNIDYVPFRRVFHEDKHLGRRRGKRRRGERGV